MKEIEITRNIGISAHIDSGKTTLTERILYYAGKIHKIEEIRGGGDGPTMDFMDLEREKGITITSAATTVYWQDNKINIIDTPGHVDFTVEVERSLRVLDGAILVLCGVAGVQSQSITVDRQMRRYNVPRLAFINKLDRTGSSPERVIEALRTKLGHNAVQMQLPIGLEAELSGVVDLITEKAYYFKGERGDDIEIAPIPEAMQDQAAKMRARMLDSLSMFDDKLMELMLEEQEIPEEVIHQAIKTGVQKLELTPVFMGSAFKNKGVQNLLDAVCKYLPSPIEAKPAIALEVGNEENEVELKPDPAEPLVAMAYKITEEQFGQLTYVRIYQGTLKKGNNIVNIRTGKKSRVGRLVRMHSNNRENISEAYAGDIVSLVGVDCASGDTFCAEGTALTLESMYVAQPVISLALNCTDSTATERMSKALSRFVREDPTFRVSVNHESGETIVSGMGELHLDIYIERMKREYKVPVEVGAPQVNYREAITTNANFDYTHKKQTGGSGQFACVIGDIAPLIDENESHQGFEFVNLIKGGNIPAEYIGACEKGFGDVMAEGPLAGYQMTGIKVNLVDGKYHDVDSSDLAFRLCSRAAMKQAVRQAAPVILEPIMKVEVSTPVEYQGTVIGDLSSRRGVISNSSNQDDLAVIEAYVPLSEMFGYATKLRSYSAGKASYSMEFSKYAITPRNIQEKIITDRAEKLQAAQV